MTQRKWYVLVHQIPPKPLYLRAKIRQRLANVGAQALKNSVYFLPATSDALEDLQWIAEEVTSGGGHAWILGGEVLGGTDDAELVRTFQESRRDDYTELRRELAVLTREVSGARSSLPTKELDAALNRHRERFAEIRSIDFFDSPEGKEVWTMLQKLESKLKGTAARRKRVPRSVKGKTWVTRAGIKIDRIASAWLIRRYIDPDARFRFVDAARWKRSEDEIAFDIVGGDYSHESDRCTFETLVARFDIRDPAIAQIAEIVHDVDLKDAKFGRGDAAGIQLLLHGLVTAHPGDDERLERGLALFDDLASSFTPVRTAKKKRPVSRPSRGHK